MRWPKLMQLLLQRKLAANLLVKLPRNPQPSEKPQSRLQRQRKRLNRLNSTPCQSSNAAILVQERLIQRKAEVRSVSIDRGQSGLGAWKLHLSVEQTD